MKLNLRNWTLGLAAALAMTAAVQAGEGLIRYTFQPRGSKMVIEGTSTIHDWTVEGVIIGGAFEVDPEFQTDLSLKSVKSLAAKDVHPKVGVSIPVTSLKSTVLAGKDTMDSVMREAMRAKDNPRITYKLTEMVVKGEVPASGSPVKFDTKGDLQVSGVTNTIDMVVTMERLEGDKLKFTGVKLLKMTDFKIQPPAPKLALGMIKSGDAVTIKFDWIVGLAKPAPAATEAK